MKKKLILGIAGVIVLDLAFIFALTNGVEDPTELAAVAPLRPVSRQPQLPQLPIVDSVPIDDLAVHAKPVRNSTVSKYDSARFSVRTEKTAVRVPNETPLPNLKNTIIWYQGPERENIRSENVPAAIIPTKTTPDISVRRKKNVLSHAFSITRKPYDWVKSIASKF